MYKRQHQSSADTKVHTQQFEAAKSAFGFANHKTDVIKIAMIHTMEMKNGEQRFNNLHHSIKEEKMEDRSVIDVGKLDIYNEIVGPEFSGRETSSSR